MRKGLIAVLAILVLASACGSTGTGSPDTAGSTGYPVTVMDSLGRKVTLKSEPDRIASMAPSVTETVFAVGAGNRVVGVTTSDDYPPEVQSIETIGDAFQVNAEKVASMDTDVLFMSFDSTTKEAARNLERKTGAKVVVINPASVDEALDSVGKVGKVVGNREKARVVEERLRSELEKIRSAVEGLPEPTVFYELGYDPLFTVGPGSFVNDALQIAGGKNVAADAAQAYPQYSVEHLLEDNPEYYLAGDSAGATVEEIKNRPAYGSLRAVREEKVFVVKDALISRPGPRIVGGISEVAEILHPDAFEE